MRNFLAEIRRERGMSQKEVAQKIGATVSMIGKLERGERDLTMKWLTALGELFEISPARLLDGEVETLVLGEVDSSGECIFQPKVNPLEAARSLEEMRELAAYEHAATAGWRVAGSTATITIPQGAILIMKWTKGPPVGPAEALLGRLCVVRIEGTYPWRIGIPLAGSSPSLFHFLTLGGALHQNVGIALATPILRIDLP